MENLPLRKDALRNLGLPLQALKGTVGRIKLQIPVRQFRTAPWCIIVEDIYVIIGPINLDEVSHQKKDHICFKNINRITISCSGTLKLKSRPSLTIN